MTGQPYAPRRLGPSLEANQAAKGRPISAIQTEGAAASRILLVERRALGRVESCIINLLQGAAHDVRVSVGDADPDDDEDDDEG